MIYHFGISADWVQAIATWHVFIATLLLFLAAVAAGILAWRDLLANRKQLNLLRQASDTQLFSAILREVTGEEASHHRGLVRSKIPLDAQVDTIKNLVNRGRDISEKIRIADLTGKKLKTIQKEALIGIGIERTIAYYDRVAFFLLPEGYKQGDKLWMTPPDWVLGDINMIWLRLRNWIIDRRKTEDRNYYNPHYALDLEKVAKHPDTERIKRIADDTNHD